LGWLVIKDEKLLPKDLIFELHYLGTAQSSFTLNFSRPAAPVLAQMYRFLTLGRDGYTDIINADLANARLLSNALEKTYFTLLSNIHRPLKSATAAIQSALGQDDSPLNYVRGLPVVAFRLSDKFKSEHPHVQQRWLQQLLRIKGWIVPNYNAPKNVEQIEMLRVVIRETMSADLVSKLVADILDATESLMDTSSDNTIMMALAENSKRATTSANHPAQHRHSQATHHHGAHGHGKKGKHGPHGEKHVTENNKVEHRMAHHQKDDGGEGQATFGRPC